MLFAVRTTYRDVSEESQKRLWQVFEAWEPSFEIRSGHVRCDGMGALFIVESEHPEALLEAAFLHRPYLDVDVAAVVPIEAALPVIKKAFIWRDGLR